MECEVDVGGFSIAYTVQGEGPPLLLVPGVTMSAQRWVEAGYVEPLAASRRCGGGPVGSRAKLEDVGRRLVCT